MWSLIGEKQYMFKLLTKISDEKTSSSKSKEFEYNLSNTSFDIKPRAL